MGTLLEKKIFLKENYHSINLRFNAEVEVKFLDGIYYRTSYGALEKGWVPVSLIWHPLMYVCTLNFSPGFRVGVSLTLTPSFYFVVLHFFTDYYFLLSLLYFLSAMPPPKLKLQHIYSLCIFSIHQYFDQKQFSKNHICFVSL